MKKILLFPAFALAFLLGGVMPVSAATTYSLVEDAAIVAGGNPGMAAQIRSDVSVAPSYGGVSVVLDTPVLWTDLDTLSTDFNVTDDSCGGGSPRVQIRVDTTGDNVSDGSVRVALGPSPSFTGCTTGWQSTGNLIGNEDAGRYDYSVFGGSPFTTYSDAPASVLAGKVVGVFVVVDGSWAATATGGDGEQTVLVDNITLNSDVTTFDPVLVGPPIDMNQCKKDGWKMFNNPIFKNQGQCVSFVVSKKPVLVETVMVDTANVAGATSTMSLQMGKKYRFDVSGTWTNRSGETVDAKYTTMDDWATWMDAPDGGYDPKLLDLQVNNAFEDWGAYSGAHAYSLMYMPGATGPASFRVFDGNVATNTPDASWYGDNVGMLTVKIYEMK